MAIKRKTAKPVRKAIKVASLSKEERSFNFGFFRFDFTFYSFWSFVWIFFI